MIEDVIKIAKEAGSKVFEIYNTNEFNKKSKEDNSPITEADIISNEIITAGLRKISNYPILTEEAYINHDDRKAWNNFWLVDPLDGTKDFCAKNGEFAINIAFLEDCTPILGIIYAPVLDEIYYAEKGKGAFLIKRGEQFRLPQQKCTENIIARSRFHDVPAIDQFAKSNLISKSMAIGSALKFGRLASGVVNIYPRFSGSKEWDIAAGHIIIKEAGCEIIDLVTLTEPVYNKPDVRNNFFVAYSKEIRFENISFPEVKR